MRRTPRTVLVTGGAGLIGSHIAELALATGWQVRIFDNLDQHSHRQGKPDWLPAGAEFMLGDVRRRADWKRALDGINIVFHEAAYCGSTSDPAKCIHVNVYGTSLMLETLRDQRFPVEKIVFASSQAVYNEGAYCCSWHGPFFGTPRSVAQLAAGDFAVHCPQCHAAAMPIPTDERAPTGGDNVYAISKAAEERLLLDWGQVTGTPVTALRYACTYGPRQPARAPYTRWITAYCRRLLNDQPPTVDEDGRQVRDLISVHDVARASLLAATDDRAAGRIFNVGTGRPIEASELARLLARLLQRPFEPIISGAFRPGEHRALITDSTRLASLGFRPEIDLETGLEHYLAWVRDQGTIEDYFAPAVPDGRRRQLIRTPAARLPRAS